MVSSIQGFVEGGWRHPTRSVAFDPFDEGLLGTLDGSESGDEAGQHAVIELLGLVAISVDGYP